MHPACFQAAWEWQRYFQMWRSLHPQCHFFSLPESDPPTIANSSEQKPSARRVKQQTELTISGYHHFSCGVTRVSSKPIQALRRDIAPIRNDLPSQHSVWKAHVEAFQSPQGSLQVQELHFGDGRSAPCPVPSFSYWLQSAHITHTAAHSSSADKPAKDWTGDDSQIPSSDETSTLDIGFKRIQRDSLLFHAVSGVSASREANPAPHPSKEFA